MSDDSDSDLSTIVDFEEIKPEICIEPTDGFDFVEALSTKIDVLDNILNFLPYTDLKICSQIHEVWANRAEFLIKKRLEPVGFTMPLYIRIPFKPIFIKPALFISFILYNSKNADSAKMPYLSTFICIQNKDNDVRKHVIEYIENDILSNEKCPVVALTCRKFYSSLDDHSLLNGFIFPVIPNVNISVFRVRRTMLTQLSSVINEYVGENNNVACLLSYSISTNKQIFKKFIATLKERQPLNKFAFGGGYVLGIKDFNIARLKTLYNKVYRKNEILCVTFNVPKGIDAQFRAYSIIIPESVRSDEDIEEYLIELRKNYVPRKHGVAFKITCVSRNDNFRSLIKIFKKHFPLLDIIEFIGDGEIGWNCYRKTEEEEEPESKKIKDEEGFFHQLTAIFVIITWGRELKT